MFQGISLAPLHFWMTQHRSVTTSGASSHTCRSSTINRCKPMVDRLPSSFIASLRLMNNLQCWGCYQRDYAWFSHADHFWIIPSMSVLHIELGTGMLGGCCNDVLWCLIYKITSQLRYSTSLWVYAHSHRLVGGYSNLRNTFNSLLGAWLVNWIIRLSQADKYPTSSIKHTLSKFVGIRFHVLMQDIMRKSCYFAAVIYQAWCFDSRKDNCAFPFK